MAVLMHISLSTIIGTLDPSHVFSSMRVSSGSSHVVAHMMATGGLHGR
jgi:hypothetical protein